MPSLRDSGKLVGTFASLRETARQCHLSFPLSIRDFIATPHCPFPRCNHLHLKVLTNPTVPIETMLNRMREVYSTAGIRVEVVSRETLTLPLLNALDIGGCARGITTAEQNQLFQNENGVTPGRRANELVVFFVQSVIRSTGGTLNGCASHPGGRPGAAIAQTASQWTLAHEVGHVLGLEHITGEHQGCPSSNPDCCATADFTRLMTGCSTSNITGTPTVSRDEIETMTDSNLTRGC